MLVEVVSVRRFRSLRRVELDGCASTNILIGKNNSGKSNVLAGLAEVIEHLRAGSVSSLWNRRGKPSDEIYNRESNSTIQIGLQLSLNEPENTELRKIIGQSTEGVDLALDQLAGERHFSIIINGTIIDGALFRYVHEISFGKLDVDNDIISTIGRKVFSLPEAVAPEVINFEQALLREKKQLRAIERASIDVGSRGFTEGARAENRYYIRRAMEDIAEPYAAQFEHAALQSSSNVEFTDRTRAILSEIEKSISEISARTTSATMLSVAGSVRKPPEYVTAILELIGRIQLLDFKEARQQIGPDEAYQLLRLKTKRGGPEQLTSLQSVVRSLLGVSVDAFESDDDASVSAARLRQNSRGTYVRPAEIDIDDFLVAANGAGIREALRIVLDLELKRPDIALIEEPEVHLHPGLERMLHEYLVRKSDSVQIFLATHSTNFLDVASQQSVFIVSKSGEGSKISRAISEDEVLLIPSEIGLRPSTVFMYDKLVFVEGTTDQDVIFNIAEKLDIDLVSKNIGFVKMGGASNFGYFASDATLDLLTRRQIPMVFVLDSDEKTSAEIDKIKNRLGDRAKFHTFQRRELENYLLEPEAVHHLIITKLETSDSKIVPPTIPEVKETIKSVAEELAQRVIDLRIAHELLKPVHINRQNGNNGLEKFKSAIDELTARIAEFEKDASDIGEEVNKDWKNKCLDRAPGSNILSGTMAKYGLTYNKGRDAVRLSDMIPSHSILHEIRTLIQLIAS